MKWLLALLLAVICSPIEIEPKLPPYVPKAVVVKAKPSTEKCLAWVINDEARGESLQGARAVLDAVKTRMKKRKMGACQVIAQKSQFSGYRPGKLKTVTDSMLGRYYKASKMQPVFYGCDYFHATYVRPQWADEMTLCGSVGNHVFYKERKIERK